MNVRKNILLVAGIIIALLGAFLTLGGTINMIEGTSIAKDLVLTLFMGVAPALGGIWMVKKSMQKTPSIEHNKKAAFLDSTEMMERKILQLAAKSKGKLTTSEVALKTHITLEKAEELLNNMQEKGHVELQISPKGSIVYYFHGLLSKEDREGTSDLLP